MRREEEREERGGEGEARSERGVKEGKSEAERKTNENNNINRTSERFLEDFRREAPRARAGGRRSRGGARACSPDVDGPGHVGDERAGHEDHTHCYGDLVGLLIADGARRHGGSDLE